MQNQFRLILKEMVLNVEKKILNILENFSEDTLLRRVYKLITPYYLTNYIRKFFAVNPLSQLLDDTNPLAELTHKRKLSPLGAGGLKKERVKMDVREIHTSQYGRVCPIETSDGKNAGLVMALAKGARVNKYGFLESPFYF
jgi:DNA-directed RNA polymerase subunit beta